MKKGKYIVYIIAFLLAAIIIVPQRANAESGYTYINLGDANSLYDKTVKEWKPSARVKYGKYYYWAVTDGTSYSNGSNYALFKVDYYRAKSKTGTGTKLFSNYEIYGGDNDTLDFYTNGTYIIKTATTTKNPNVYVYRYNMKGKSRKTLQTFKAGSSSDEGKGYSSHCDARILKVYGGKVYAAYKASGSGMGVNIVSFPVKSKKKAKTICTTYNYFVPAKGLYIGLGGNSGTSVYNLKTGKTLKITSSRGEYLGRYKNKEYYYIEKDGKTTIYSANTAWKKRTKVGTLSKPIMPFMRGKRIYYFAYNDEYKEVDYAYDVVAKSTKEITLESYHKALNKYYDTTKIKDRYIYW